ncbi:interferon regulatory factor 3 [Notolabrus celidotus]|uniref:interferon regulatory factor 3 n=1 Tax=Notolabrus celidotus TaxID=1203425 RepID=UPI0014904CBC|nr:interferon regulatory factor 3 [Notolabrus celidotus]
MSYSKPLLIPWLRERINSERYPGVQWTNPEQTEFSIPWKHALRQDSSDTDILIFKAWAEVSGNGRAQGDASVWKRNFRSALRAKKFKLVSDNKNDAAHPHKVFGWPNKSAPGGNSSAGSQEQDDPDLLEECPLPIQESQVVPCLDDFIFRQNENALSDSAGHNDILQECLQALKIDPETEGFEPPPEQQQLQIPAVIGAQAFPGQQQYPVTFEGAVVEAGFPEQPACPMEGAVGGSSDRAEQFLQTIIQTTDGNSFRTQFRILVYYRGVKVSEQLVNNEAGFRLVYRPELNGTVFDPETGLSIVSLPSPGAMLDQTQTRLTQQILNKLGDGLDVGVSGPVVYSQRQGEIKAFWSLSKHDSSRQIQEISKLQPVPLFQFKDFVQGILDFIERSDSPPCSLFFCLGEKWPDPEGRPWVKKLITVEVVLTSMELLKNLAVEGGSSSLRSVELQMSLEEMMELS